MRPEKRPQINYTACHPSGEFAAKLEAFQDRLVRMGPSIENTEGWFF